MNNTALLITICNLYHSYSSNFLEDLPEFSFVLTEKVLSYFFDVSSVSLVLSYSKIDRFYFYIFLFSCMIYAKAFLLLFSYSFQVFASSFSYSSSGKLWIFWLSFQIESRLLCSRSLISIPIVLQACLVEGEFKMTLSF